MRSLWKIHSPALGLRNLSKIQRLALGLTNIWEIQRLALRLTNIWKIQRLALGLINLWKVHILCTEHDVPESQISGRRLIQKSEEAQDTQPAHKMVEHVETNLSNARL